MNLIWLHKWKLAWKYSHSKRYTNTNPPPGQYLMHAYSHITRWVAAMDNCFALTEAHHHGIIVRSMNGENLCLKDPLLPGQLLKLQEAHIQQPTSWPVPHACACVQPYHAGSGSHRQLFHHRVKEQRKPVSLIAVGSAKHSYKHQLHTTGPRHGSFPTTRREVRSWVGVCMPLALSLSYENSELKRSIE